MPSLCLSLILAFSFSPRPPRSQRCRLLSLPCIRLIRSADLDELPQRGVVSWGRAQPAQLVTEPFGERFISQRHHALVFHVPHFQARRREVAALARHLERRAVTGGHGPPPQKC